MAASPALIIKLAPEFDAIDSADIQQFIELAKLRLAVCSFRTRTNASGFSQYDLALSYMVAHMLTNATSAASSSSGSGTTSGEITSTKVGDLSVTYSTNTSDINQEGGGDLNGTRYGRQLLQMLKGLVKSPRVVC